MFVEKRYPPTIYWHDLKKHISALQGRIKKYHREGSFTIKPWVSLFFWFVPALFFVIFFRLLKPWVIIRIRQHISIRIGHFAVNTEVYLCEKDLGMNNPDQHFLDIWYYNGYICNMQLQKMWNRVLKIWPTHLSMIIVIINSLMPDGVTYTIPWRNEQAIDFNNVLARVPPHLSFTKDEEEYGRRTLESMGVLPGSSFICFVGRDSKYLQMVYSISGTDNTQDYRNTDVKNYLPAVEELANRGYSAIRMGSVVAESLESNNPKIIDYATNSQRCEFMDIYLGAKCNFFISVGTGIDEIAEIFRRPVLYVNLVPLEYIPTWNKDSICIPRNYWLNKEQRLMSFREIIGCGAGRFLFTDQYVYYGITLIENTPEEIREVTIEMDERLKGTWVTTEDDEDLQRRFWNLYPPSELHGKIYSRIGAAFLRKYQTLLD